MTTLTLEPPQEPVSIIWYPEATEWFARHTPKPILLPIQEVNPMDISATALKLVMQYLERINDEEHPAQAADKGFTPRELGTRRKVAHDKLMQQLASEGILFTDRIQVTDFAKRCDAWLRD